MTVLLHPHRTDTGDGGISTVRQVPPTGPYADPVDPFGPPVTDDDFVLDMRVVEATTPLVIMMCSTSDGCGSSCGTSACATNACDPL